MLRIMCFCVGFIDRSRHQVSKRFPIYLELSCNFGGVIVPVRTVAELTESRVLAGVVEFDDFSQYGHERYVVLKH